MYTSNKKKLKIKIIIMKYINKRSRGNIRGGKKERRERNREGHTVAIEDGITLVWGCVLLVTKKKI